jgi:superfamily II DNA or RNA helicase
MDGQLEEITTWFQSLEITVNIDKLKRQLSIISRWFDYKCIGAVEAVTGFGKTYIAIIGIHRLNKKYPDATTNVIVPSTKLYKDWRKHIEKFSLQNVKVYVVNSYTQEYVKTGLKYKCNLLVCDEVHRYLGKEGILFNKTISCTEYNMFLGLSATLTEEEKETLESIGIRIVDTVSMSEARRFGYVADYVIYNLGITLSPGLRAIYEQFNDVFNGNKPKFDYFLDYSDNLDLYKACVAGKDVRCKVKGEWKSGLAWREWYAQTMGWDGTDDEHPWSPKKISNYAHQLRWATDERKKFLYNSDNKVEITRQIVNKLKVATITFAETTSFVDKLVAAIGSDARPYHTNLKGIKSVTKVQEYKTIKYLKEFLKKTNGTNKGFDEIKRKYLVEYEKVTRLGVKKAKEQILEGFDNKEFNVLCTARALDEGTDIPFVELAIICSATSKQRATIQRNGRALRFLPNKKAIIVNLYIKDTQEESWLKRRQKGETNIRWIEDINDII